MSYMSTIILHKVLTCHTVAAVKGKSVTFRPKGNLRERLEKLAKATERPLTYYIEKAIEAHLPALEEKYAKEIADLAERESYRINPQHSLIEDRPKKRAK